METDQGMIDAKKCGIRMALALACLFIFSLSFSGLIYTSYLTYNASHPTEVIASR